MQILPRLFRSAGITYRMAENSGTYLCFVYGTLKKGQPNHHFLINEETGTAEFISHGHTVNKYPLVIAGQYNIPFLLYMEGKGHEIQGEVYRVNEKKREFLDDFESHPKFYERMLTDIVTPDEKSPSGESKTIQCWVYFLKNYKPEMLELEAYPSYDSCGPHGLRYVDRYLRDKTAYEAYKNSEKD